MRVIDDERLKFRNYEWLYKKHIIEKISIRKLEEVTGVTRRVISRWMDELGVKKRSKEEGASIANKSRKYKYGEDNHLWKGGKTKSPTGYVFVRIDGEMRLEHRVIMEKHLGRKLKPDEHIHHINGVKDDNRIENLRIVDPVEHQRIHKEIDIPKNKLIDLINEGKNLTEISKVFGVNIGTIKKRINNYNLIELYDSSAFKRVKVFSKTCIKCGQVFTERRESRIRSRKFCSLKCVHEYNRSTKGGNKQ